MAALAAELVESRVNVIVATGAAPVAMLATATIPIVLLSAGDPVKQGLVASLNRPGGNITGVSALTFSERLEILRELVPQAKVIAASQPA